MFWTWRKRVPAQTIANELLLQMCSGDLKDSLKYMTVTPESKTAAAAKTQLYQFACLLLAVLSEEQRVRQYSSVRVYLEAHFFPPSAGQGINILGEVKAAMDDISHLLDPNKKQHQMRWSMKWLASVGIDESNPATLALFAIRWLAHFSAVSKVLRRFKPVA